MQNLFEDQVKFACVLFDVQETADGKLVPMPGSGWASIEGGSAFRISSIADLSHGIKWLTNLSQDILWKSGLAKQTRLKHSAYLKTDISQLSREMGMVIPNTPVTKICETLSAIFNKVMRLAMDFYGLKDFSQKDLHLELKSALLTNDNNISAPLDEALSRAYQDLVVCDHRLQKDGQIFVSLKRPRYFHAKSILDTAVPDFKGEWTFLAPNELPPNPDKIIEFLMSLNKPFIAKVSIDDFDSMDEAFINLKKLLNLGEALADNGKTKERNWVCQPELLYLSRFAKVNIHAVFVAPGYKKLNEVINLPYLGELSDFSISLGILAECLWIGMAGRSINPQTRSKSLVSPRACWLKAADKFLTFTSAVMISSAGFTVTSYSYGAVNVLVDEDQMERLIEIAPHAGLSVPLSVLEKRNIRLQ